MKNMLACFLISTLLCTEVLAQSGFLFSTFRDEATPMSEQIYFGVSQDGKKWDSLNGDSPVLISHVGEQGVRDSFLLRSHDGTKVWLIATDLCINRNNDWHRATHKGSRSIVIWETTNLVDWSAPRLALVAPEDAGCVWAPEAIYDGEVGEYLVYWASTNKSDNYAKQRLWATHTRDFLKFDRPFIYLERPHHVIDIHIVRDADAYYRFLKDDNTKSVGMESSRNLKGPWKEVGPFSAGKGKNFEGPICYQHMATSKAQTPAWTLLLDNVSDRIGAGAFGYTPYVSNKIDEGVFTPAPDFAFPYAFRHGSVLAINKDELDRLKRAYPSPQKAAR